MKLGKFVALNLLCLATLPATAQTYTEQTKQDTEQSTEKLAEYIKNWAAYLGYPISNPPSAPPTQNSTQLVNFPQAYLAETSLLTTFFGSIPTVTPPNSDANSNSSASAGAPFVPSSVTGADGINERSNLTFKNYTNINQQDSSAMLVNANPLTDQLPFQSDPVSQSILNILGTPDVSYCTDSKGIVSNPTNPNALNNNASQCSDLGPTMFQNQIVENVIGTLPDPSNYFSFNKNKNILAQLNSNALIAPLNYSTEASNSGTSQEKEGVPGLTAQNQAQQAANFIRYVSGSVIPTLLPNQKAYQKTYQQAQDNSSPATQAYAQAVLSTYLTSLRVYAAQTSVGMGNLYYILSRRLPQQMKKNGGEGQGNNSLPSQALNEYTMATWRIFNPTSAGDNQDKPQWVDKINSATPATVQKEIAILLSEINYQLYLDRQIQERMLFTQSVSLLQGTKAGQPNSDLSNMNTSASSATSSEARQ